MRFWWIRENFGKFDAEEVGNGIGVMGLVAIYSGNFWGPNAADNGDEGDDWDSESEDDLQIVLNDNNHGHICQRGENGLRILRPKNSTTLRANCSSQTPSDRIPSTHHPKNRSLPLHHTLFRLYPPRDWPVPEPARYRASTSIPEKNGTIEEAFTGEIPKPPIVGPERPAAFNRPTTSGDRLFSPRISPARVVNADVWPLCRKSDFGGRSSGLVVVDPRSDEEALVKHSAASGSVGRGRKVLGNIAGVGDGESDRHS
ncbi:FIP1[V]-like protein [Actinidia rufa]|uniref:FIP1[V]-like protein n=1 Tax=Actinidia rufa TaxID=165716 RepID=A0A7J0FB83_9ERIC|nr:FIP1[V]-like protein [Actinidia rufa]